MDLGNNICFNILNYAWRNNIDVVDREVSNSIFIYGNRMLFDQVSNAVSVFEDIRDVISLHCEINYYEYNH